MDTSRNWLFIQDREQKALAELTVFVMGVGIGSVFAELALRTGIHRFIIADGDVVDASNLNRQNYTESDLSRSKAHACAARLRAIDAQVEVEVIDQFLDEAALESFIPRADIVINTIDFDSPVFPVASRLCRQAGKLELFPMNLGFGSGVCLFTADSPSWESAFEWRDHVELKQKILEHFARSQAMAPYLREAFIRYQMGERKDYDPQLGISTYVTASLLMSLIVRLVKGEQPAAFPAFHYVDPFLSQS